MSRGVGVTAALSDLPAVVVVLFAFVTQLGDFWFVFSAGALAYWLGGHAPRIGPGLTRERAAMVLALLVAAIALTVTLKTAFGLPRPSGAGVASEATLFPEFAREVYVSMATGDGYGFPSGHATVATLVWGGFAWAVRVGRRRQRAAVAGTVIGLVALSRLVIGVHFAVDVLAGAAIAGGFLWLALTFLRTPGRVFAAAALVSLAGLAAGGVTRDVGAAVGMSVAATVVWTALPDPPEPTRWGALATVGLGAVTVGGVLTVALWLVSGTVSVALLAALGTALLLALPLLGERVAKK
jgi:membrane-associated phospholipid phosphatase